MSGPHGAPSRRQPAPGAAPKLVIALLALTAIGVHVSARVISARAGWPRLAPTLRYHPQRAHLFSPDALRAERLARLPVPLESTLRSGETLTTLLVGAGVEPSEAYRAATAAAVLTDLKKLRSGDAYTIFYDGDAPVAVHLAIGDQGRLELERGAPSWQGAFRAYDRRVELRTIRGELDGLLEAAIERAGGDANLAYAMADVLQWDLDFNRDLRLGDAFEVLYERVFLDERFHAVGRVLALGYDSGERRLSAYLYGDGEDYYDADGRPLQKMFLRSPMRYTRVTSGFSNRRLHPILGTYRPHYGVDYAAPRGTPVRVTATGVVASAGWESGGGRVVRVRHPNGYLTAYLHLSGFADGIRSGARVRQGQVIGFVGATGLATAPHLDYRVRLAERWIDPLSLPNEPAPPIPNERLGEFYAWRDALELGLKEGESRPEVLMAVRLEPGGAPADASVAR